MQRNWEFDNEFNFQYWLSDLDIVDTADYIEAIHKAVRLLSDDMAVAKKSKIALLLSGVDSELIAKCLYLNNIPVEYFYLHINGINDSELLLCQEISNRYSTKLNVIQVDYFTLLETQIEESFQITKVCWPTYLVLPYLIKRIPDDYYITIGEGDLEKDNIRYGIIYKDYQKDFTGNEFFVPIHLTEISYRLALDHYGKSGESNFFSRCFDLWYHILKDPDLITNRKYYYDPKKVLLKKYSEGLLSPNKTLNFLDKEKKQSIINHACKLGKALPGWHRYIGDIIKIPNYLI
jgi:hypothetical protein